MGAVLDLINVLFSPGAVFERVREKPKFILPFIGLAIPVMIIQFLTLPYAKAAMSSVYAQMATQNPQAAEAAQKFAFVGVFFWPIILAIVLLLTALFLWVLVSVLGGEGKFGTLLSVTTYASITFVLAQVVGLLILMVKGKENLVSPDDLQPAMGLDLVLPVSGRFLSGLLKGINPFSIWGTVLTAIGIAVTHKQSKGIAYTAAILSTLFILVIFSVLGATCAPRAPGS
jgi:hypothetical protein